MADWNLHRRTLARRILAQSAVLWLQEHSSRKCPFDRKILQRTIHPSASVSISFQDSLVTASRLVALLLAKEFTIPTGFPDLTHSLIYSRPTTLMSTSVFRRRCISTRCILVRRQYIWRCTLRIMFEHGLDFMAFRPTHTHHQTEFPPSTLRFAQTGNRVCFFLSTHTVTGSS